MLLRSDNARFLSPVLAEGSPRGNPLVYHRMPHPRIIASLHRIGPFQTSYLKSRGLAKAEFFDRKISNSLIKQPEKVQFRIQMDENST